jgi:hypothetical protein
MCLLIAARPTASTPLLMAPFRDTMAITGRRMHSRPILVSLCRHKAGLSARARHICVAMTTVSFTRVWESADVAAPTSNLMHFTVSHNFTARWQPG